jgi:hypothetical protein
MVRSPNRRLLRTSLTGLLVLLQVHLVWIGELHRHSFAEALPPSTTSLREGSQQPAPVVDTELLCTACQVVQHSAARPAISTPTPGPVAAVSFRPTVASSDFNSHQPNIQYGRAPPLFFS